MIHNTCDHLPSGGCQSIPSYSDCLLSVQSPAVVPNNFIGSSSSILFGDKLTFFLDPKQWFCHIEKLINGFGGSQ